MVHGTAQWVTNGDLGDNTNITHIFKRIHSRFRWTRAGFKLIGPIAPSWAPRPILHTVVQVDWEPGPTEIVANWAPHLQRPALSGPHRFLLAILLTFYKTDITVLKPNQTTLVKGMAPHSSSTWKKMGSHIL